MLGRAGLPHVAQQEGRPLEAEGCGYLAIDLGGGKVQALPYALG